MKNWLTIVAVALVIGGAGYAIYHKTQSPPVEMPAQADTIAAVPPAAPEAGAKTSIVTQLPDVSLKNREGNMQSLRSWPGKSMIVNFWATWCAPCRKEIPLLKEIAAGEAKEGFQVVGIAIDVREDVLKYADEIKIDYPLLMGEQEGLNAAEAFGVASVGLPFTAFTDKDGRMVTLLMGELTRAKVDVILGGVRRVNSGELTPDAARAAIAMALQKIRA